VFDDIRVAQVAKGHIRTRRARSRSRKGIDFCSDRASARLTHHLKTHVIKPIVDADFLRKCKVDAGPNLGFPGGIRGDLLHLLDPIVKIAQMPPRGPNARCSGKKYMKRAEEDPQPGDFHRKIPVSPATAYEMAIAESRPGIVSCVPFPGELPIR